jgi:hypothetical protein
MVITIISSSSSFKKLKTNKLPGDWSDKSPLWTERMRALAGKKYSDEDDGTFWMSVDDFAVEFAKLYTCKIFPADKWTSKIIKVRIAFFVYKNFIVGGFIQ